MNTPSAASKARTGRPATRGRASVSDAAGTEDLQDNSFLNPPRRGRAATISDAALSGAASATFREQASDSPSPRRSAAESTFTGCADEADPAVEAAVNSSPVVLGLRDLVAEQRRALHDLREVSLAAQAQLALLGHTAPLLQATANADNAPPGPSGPPCPSGPPDPSGSPLQLPDYAQARISQLQQRLSDAESALAKAKADVAAQVQAASRKSRSSQRKPVTQSNLLDRYYKSVPLEERLALNEVRFAKLSSAQPARQVAFVSASTMRAAYREHHRPELYDRAERRAIATADAVEAEAASQDTNPDLSRTREGYVADEFCVPDDTFDDLLSGDSSETGDDSCTTLDSELDTNSDESADEAPRRMRVIEAAIARSKSKSKQAAFIHQSCTDAELAEMRKVDVTIKRRTSRTDIIELLLNGWLRSDICAVKLSHIAELLRQLSLLPAEYATSVYYALTKRIRPVSNTFFKLLARCILEYLPNHAGPFGTAYRAVTGKQPTPAKTPAPALAPLLPRQSIASLTDDEHNRRKPQTRAPSIEDINDIATATGSFYNTYRAYARDWKGYAHKSVFECLTPDQASDFASFSRKSEEYCASLSTENFMELWRETYGVRSSVAILQALRAVPFKGQILRPASWSRYHQRFLAVIQQAPKRLHPPGKITAEIFMHNCRVDYLEQDVMAYEPTDHRAALDLVLTRLNDGGFLQNADLHKAIRDSQRDDPTERRRHDHETNRDVRRFPNRPASRPTDQQRHSDTEQPRRDLTVRPDAPPPRRDAQLDPHRSAPAPHRPPSALPTKPRSLQPTGSTTCVRCSREGHSIDACVAKHDADGKLLPPVADSVYAQRKANALAIATARLKAVHAINIENASDASSATEDIEGEAAALFAHQSHDLSSDSDTGIGCIHLLPRGKPRHFDSRAPIHRAPIPETVPAPSLLDDGDVEPNPGPIIPELPPMPALTSDSSASDSDDANRTRGHGPANDAHVQHGVHSTSIHVVPSQHRPPRSCFRPRPHPNGQPLLPNERLTMPPAPHVSDIPASINPSTASPQPEQPTIHDSSTDSNEYDHPATLKHISAILHVSSDTSDIDAQALEAMAPRICGVSAQTAPSLLPPPQFIGFLTAIGSTFPDPPTHTSAYICAIDTMCQGKFSIISRTVAVTAQLPLRPLSRTCRTADGTRVTCSHASDFNLTIRLKDAWSTFKVTALVWDTASEPLLICNSLALQTGLIDFVAPNATRTSQYGQAAFSADWREILTNADTVAASTYHEDVMPEDVDDIIDLSAPLRCGDQDISTLPSDALAYARKYPWMTKAIPKDAHAGLDKWKAHVREEAIPLYSWPKVTLKDLKEDKIPFPVVPQLHREFDKLIAMHYAEEVTECPTAVAMRAQLVSKNKKETRFCVNGSTQKNVLAVASFPMPHIRQIFSFVSSFPFRAKLDLKHGYHNFDIDPASRKWTVTIGAGRAIQWRKLVQGFAPSGAFFQHAMVKLLGPGIVWVIAAVYLDDIIVVGKTKKECAANVDTVMATLAHYRFRINFAKCQFTPSTNIDFLGCSLRGSMVHPGPKVPLMLAKILPPHIQRTPKAQRHHLHVFLGMCAFVLQHCPGLKTTLAPLYVAVASDPFTYGHTERDAFEHALGMLANLQPYFLPSCDPDVTIELMTDASGGNGTPSDPGSWAAVLGQRKGQFNVDSLTDNFELVQTEGGVFNSRQASWDILKKEGFALFQALHRFKQFIWGRHIRIITDSKVLMFMFRSDNAVIKRWHAFIQTFDYSMIHVNSDANSIADCLTRCLSAPPPVQDRTPRLLSPTAHVPAPSLLEDGDIEPNPGPLRHARRTIHSRHRPPMCRHRVYERASIILFENTRSVNIVRSTSFPTWTPCLPLLDAVPLLLLVALWLLLRQKAPDDPQFIRRAVAPQKSPAGLTPPATHISAFQTSMPTSQSDVTTHYRPPDPPLIGIELNPGPPTDKLVTVVLSSSKKKKA